MNEVTNSIIRNVKAAKEDSLGQVKADIAVFLALAEIGDLTKDCPRCAEAVHTLIVESLDK